MAWRARLAKPEASALAGDDLEDHWGHHKTARISLGPGQRIPCGVCFACGQLAARHQTFEEQRGEARRPFPDRARRRYDVDDRLHRRDLEAGVAEARRQSKSA